MDNSEERVALYASQTKSIERNLKRFIKSKHKTLK